MSFAKGMKVMTTICVLLLAFGIVQSADPVAVNTSANSLPAAVVVKPVEKVKVVNTSVVKNSSTVDIAAVQFVQQNNVKLPKQKTETVLIAEVADPKTTTPKSEAITMSAFNFALISLPLIVSALPLIVMN